MVRCFPKRECLPSMRGNEELHSPSVATNMLKTLLNPTKITLSTLTSVRKASNNALVFVCFSYAATSLFVQINTSLSGSNAGL